VQAAIVTASDPIHSVFFITPGRDHNQQYPNNPAAFNVESSPESELRDGFDNNLVPVGGDLCGANHLLQDSHHSKVVGGPDTIWMIRPRKQPPLR
jgi:hypothetical protein